ncbi:MAG: DUF4388 domain-containing protein [Anaerolineaceae bacterium]
MSVQGNLKDLAVADLIQHNCQDYKTGKILIQNAAGEAAIYLKEGQVVHAALNGQEGEEVVFQILSWNEGTFILETGVKPPAKTIDRSWSSLLLEGARRLDENKTNSIQSDSNKHLEVNKMSKLDDILKEMSGEITGYVACALAGMDGINIASHTSNKAMDPDAISAQMTMLLKLVDTSVDKLGAGVLEDNLTTTENAYILMRLLPGKQYYLGMAASHKTGNLGNMRLISKMYAERLAKAMPS